jgi:hypothetical protein
MKRKELTGDYLMNGWLVKYHGITIAELIEKEPELMKTSGWYLKYAVTQEQHDEWYEWAIKEVMKYYRYSRKVAVKQFTFPYLNLAPAVKDEKPRD